MAKHQIFLVHGMGNFEPGWSTVVREAIAGAFASYRQLADGNFAAGFEFKEITYNGVFESWREQWRDDAAAAAGALSALGLNSGVADRLVGLAQAPAGDGFWQTHVLDVVMYRYLLPVTEAVCRSVQEQILGHLNAFPAGDRPPFSVIAHSLGTAVVYETFHAMLTSTVGPDGLRLGSAYRPANVAMISNVAKILWNRGGNLYTPDLGPNLASGAGLCRRFGNFRHALDPISRVDPFAPTPGWFASTAPRDKVYIDVELEAADIQELNVHSLEHYLGHPDVHVPLLRMLVGWFDCVSADELARARRQWRAKRLKDQALQKARQDLRALLVESTTDWLQEVPMLLEFRSKLLALRRRDGES